MTIKMDSQRSALCRLSHGNPFSFHVFSPSPANLRSEIHGMKRIDSRDCSVEALREAVFNTVVYRDYIVRGLSSCFLAACSEKFP